ncbi:hypothetical protein SAMN05216187_11091 [Jeotgalicoccus aerolatus]|uniref:Uncharacterized protein n=1 Tax=Jeotgalicoccus aerolatus TaxID=709510 RepID=A0A1G9CY29_9STAP|nr:hypothetical protein [Jeotgalicoccus aerolatus]SDK56598.1 hypothetical protein SAMN05216187_11091 [Jeotgalicoccus aerolatus]
MEKIKQIQLKRRVKRAEDLLRTIERALYRANTQRGKGPLSYDIYEEIHDDLVDDMDELDIAHAVEMEAGGKEYLAAAGLEDPSAETVDPEIAHTDEIKAAMENYLEDAELQNVSGGESQ